MAKNNETVWRIRDWRSNYEYVQGRSHVKELTWVALSVRMDDACYVELVEHPDGAAHLGAQIAIVRVAASCCPRGTLLLPNGRPHNVDSIARLTRLPAGIVKQSIERLVEMGWMEEAPIEPARREQQKIRSEENGARPPRASAFSPPVALTAALEQLGMEDEQVGALKREIQRAAGLYGGMARLAEGLQAAIKADCRDWNTAVAWLRRAGWSEADHKPTQNQEVVKEY